MVCTIDTSAKVERFEYIGARTMPNVVHIKPNNTPTLHNSMCLKAADFGGIINVCYFYNSDLTPP